MTASVIGDALLVLASTPADVDLAALADAPTTSRRVIAFTDAEPARVREALPWLSGLVNAVVVLPPLDPGLPERRCLASASLQAALAPPVARRSASAEPAQTRTL